MEVIIMAGMTGEIVFVMLMVGIVWIGMICLGKIRENESKQEELERRRRMEGAHHTKKEIQVQKNGEEVEKQKNKNIEMLQERLFQTEEKLWEIEKAEGYETFFHKIVMPLQILLGFTEISFDTLTDEQVRYYTEEVIIDPILKAVEQAKGHIVNGKLLLSLTKEQFDKEKVRKNIEYLEKVELENYIQKNEKKLEIEHVVLQKIGVVQGLGSMIEELKQLKQDSVIERGRICELAKKIKRLLEENKIYPMFAADKRLVSYPELKRRYIPVNENSIRYPGLFIERNGVLEVFGANIGMDDCGV